MSYNKPEEKLIWESYVKEDDLSHSQYEGPDELEPLARIEPQEMGEDMSDGELVHAAHQAGVEDLIEFDMEGGVANRDEIIDAIGDGPESDELERVPHGKGGLDSAGADSAGARHRMSRRTKPYSDDDVNYDSVRVNHARPSQRSIKETGKMFGDVQGKHNTEQETSDPMSMPRGRALKKRKNVKTKPLAHPTSAEINLDHVEKKVGEGARVSPSGYGISAGPRKAPYDGVSNPDYWVGAKQGKGYFGQSQAKANLEKEGCGCAVVPPGEKEEEPEGAKTVKIVKSRGGLPGKLVKKIVKSLHGGGESGISLG